jgi:hypothetical protein
LLAIRGQELLKVKKMKKVIYLLLIGIGMVLLFSGCVVVTITEDLQNPFLITMTWNGKVLEPDSESGRLPIQTFNLNGAVITATVTDEYGDPVLPDVYEWYLKGELIEEWHDNTVVLDDTLEMGMYWLDIIVGKGTIISSEQLEFIKDI